MKDALTARLAQLAALNQTVSYGKLARDLGLTGPSTIARLTAALEHLMDEDAANNLPLRAALLAGRLAKDLPAQGFFNKAAALGRYQTQDPTDYIAAERALLHFAFSKYPTEG